MDYPLDKKAIEILKKIEKSIDMIEHRPTELFCQEYATSRLNVAKSTAEEKEGELARLIGLSNDFKLEIGVQKRMLDRYKNAVNAGAIIKTLDGKPFLYGKEDYKNPSILIKRSDNLND